MDRWILCRKPRRKKASLLLLTIMQTIAVRAGSRSKSRVRGNIREDEIRNTIGTSMTRPTPISYSNKSAYHSNRTLLIITMKGAIIAPQQQAVLNQLLEELMWFGKHWNIKISSKNAVVPRNSHLAMIKTNMIPWGWMRLVSLSTTRRYKSQGRNLMSCKTSC